MFSWPEPFWPFGLSLGQELSQVVQHIFPILIICEYLSTLYPPDHDVVQNTGRAQASLSWHAETLKQNSTFCQLTFLPAFPLQISLFVKRRHHGLPFNPPAGVH